MTLKIKLIITACLTAFLAVVVGAVVNRVSTMQAEQIAQAATEAVVPTEEQLPTETIIPPTATAVAVVDLALVQQREAAYQAQLTEANQRLAEASARLAEAQGQAKIVTQKYNDVVNKQILAPTTLPAPTNVPAPTAQPYMPVDAVTAIARALDADAVLQKDPELVLFQDRAAYELVFDRGTVYIAADDGAVLSNGMAGFQTVSASTGTNAGKNIDPAPTAVPEPTSKPAPTSVPAPTAVPAPNPDDGGDTHDDEHHDSEDEHDSEDGDQHD